MRASKKVNRSALRAWCSAAILGGATVAVSCQSSSGAGLSASCSLNSDCNSPYVCVFSRCHEQCQTSVDCANGERCVSSQSTGGPPDVCQLQQESTCSGSESTCAGSEVCASDQECRMPCQDTAACPGGQVCVSVAGQALCYQTDDPADQPVLEQAGILALDGAVLENAAGDSTVTLPGDAGPTTTVDGGPSADAALDSTIAPPSDSGGSQADGAGDATGGGADSNPGSGGSDGGDASIVVNVCPNAQTQFGLTAQGASNANFTSGVGVRTASALLIFSGYAGPDPSSDAGDGGDAGTVNLVYVQAFDPATANSMGPAQPLFTAPAGSGFALESASVAPTGQIALAFNYGGGYAYQSGNGSQTSLYGAFLEASPDAGPAGIALQETAEIESAEITGQPHVAWSVPTGSFVFSWEYVVNGSWFVGTKNFGPNGQATGGTDPVPAQTASATVPNSGYAQDQGSVAAGPSLFGIAFLGSSWNPWLTVLDTSGSLVGTVQVASPSNDPYWVTAGGTANGFVYIYDSGNGVAEVFVPTSADGGIVVPDGGPTGFSGFNFTGSIHAIDGHAINDDTGGIGGVGVALLYSNGVSFAYIDADGATHAGPSSVIAHTYVAGDQVNVTNFGGSFGVSLYSSATQSTQVAASGCSL
jgi:hypothetical protein